MGGDKFHVIEQRL